MNTDMLHLESVVTLNLRLATNNKPHYMYNSHP